MRYVKASGEKIRAARKSGGLTQSELGKMLGVSGSMIGQYETEARRPSLKVAREIAEKLGVPPIDLVITFDAELDTARATTVRVDELERAKVPVIEEALFSFGEYGAIIADALQRMNTDGRRIAAERIRELAEIPKYQRGANNAE